ncbi:MAG: CoA transferase [Acidimicrobiia bacterium]|nr:CoA transferase [Acidimicrobiia bacterium]
MNDPTSSAPLPLEGIRVLDLGQIYQGPYACFLMAMAGADVVKVEPPDGEPIRRRARISGASLPLAMLNSSKRAITVDLKAAAGRALLCDLAASADVLLENYAPTVMDRLGVGAGELMRRNPRLVYASGSGYGRSGPSRDDLAMDLTVQARAGYMAITGYPDRPPVKAGPAVVDFLGGAHLYGAVVTALFEVARTGRGRVVEVSMLEAAFPALASNLGMNHASGGTGAPRTANRHGGLALAPYNVYPCRDGYVAIICTTENHWVNLTAAMGRDDLGRDDSLADHTKRAARMEEVDELVAAWSSTRDRDEVWAVCREHHVPAAPVRDLPEVLADQHLRDRGFLRDLDHPELGRVTVPHSPIRYDGSALRELTASPALGQHTDEVLAEWLDLDASAIAARRAEGAC